MLAGEKPPVPRAERKEEPRQLSCVSVPVLPAALFMRGLVLAPAAAIRALPQRLRQ